MTKHHRHEKNELSSELKLFIAVTVLAGIFMLYFGGSKKKPPTINFVVVGFSYIGAMLFSNEALKYVSYPTQAL
eukprot:gene51875-69427_t